MHIKKENKKMKVSIIIPAYNVEKYVQKGIESCIQQTYENIEIIIIDDGSTDKTFDVIVPYVNNSNIFLYKQRNNGVSSARNFGLSKATGEYVLFLDSDDWLELNAVEMLLNLAIKFPNKLICADRYFVNENYDGNYIKKRQRAYKDLEVLEKECAMNNIGSGLYNLQSSCYKLFSVQIIKDNYLLFSEDISHGEDGLFVFQYLILTNGIVFTTEPYWNILERTGSATTSGYNKKWLSIILSIEKMVKLNDSQKINPKALNIYMVERLIMLEKEIAATENNNYIEDYFYVQRKMNLYCDKYKIKKTKTVSNAELLFYRNASFATMKKFMMLIKFLKKRWSKK